MTEENLDKAYGSGSIQTEQYTTKDNITVEIYHIFDALANMQQEWDDFIESVGGEIFLTYDWCRIWWKYYGHKRDLTIFVFRNGGEICGILPLFREKIWIGPLSIAVTLGQQPLRKSLEKSHPSPQERLLLQNSQRCQSGRHVHEPDSHL